MLNASKKRALLALYDTPDEKKPGRATPGYDAAHAERTTRIVQMAAKAIGLAPRWFDDLEVTTLLHDLGRAGMDATLFGKIFQLAEKNNIPIRIRELRTHYPQLSEQEAMPYFIERLRPHLDAAGIALTPNVLDHIAMRMDFRGRLRRKLKECGQTLSAEHIAIAPWMEKVMLYYYYPQDMEGATEDVRLMGMLLVACENFEAYNNRRRGEDYYGRSGEQLRETFFALDRFKKEGLITDAVVRVLKQLTASEELDSIIKEARGYIPHQLLPDADIAYEKELRASLS